MKCLIVYYLAGKWFGEEVAWKRSGSGTYREISRIEVPQSRLEIERFAREVLPLLADLRDEAVGI